MYFNQRVQAIAEESMLPKTGMLLALLVMIFLCPLTSQAAEVGSQIYWAPEPSFGVLFMSVRVWPFENFAVSGGMGETVVGNDTWPSLNAKVLWRFMDQDTLNLQTGINLAISYWLDDSLMPHFSRADFIWTMELEYQAMERGLLSIGVGTPVGWPRLMLTLGASFHVMFDVDGGFIEEGR